MPGHSNKESRRTNLRSVPGWALNESLLTGSGVIFLSESPELQTIKVGTPCESFASNAQTCFDRPPARFA